MYACRGARQIPEKFEDGFGLESGYTPVPTVGLYPATIHISTFKMSTISRKSATTKTLNAAKIAEIRSQIASLTTTLDELDSVIKIEEKSIEKAVKRKEKKAAKEAGEDSPSVLTAWNALCHGDPTPADDGEPVLSAKHAYPGLFESWCTATGITSKKGAETKFASAFRTAVKDHPINDTGKPEQEEDESDKAYGKRLAKWIEDFDGPRWTKSGAKRYAELDQRYKAIAAERRSTSTSTSSKSKKRADMTEEELEAHEAAILERREARKADTIARRAADKAAADAEKAKKTPKKTAAKPAKKGKNAAVDSDDDEPPKSAKSAKSAKPVTKSAKKSAKSESESESEPESKPVKKSAKKSAKPADSDSESEPVKKSAKKSAKRVDSDSESEPVKKSAKKSVKPADSDSETERKTPVKAKSAMSLPPPPKKAAKSMEEELEEAEDEIAAEKLTDVEVDGTTYISTPDHFLFEKVTGQPGVFGAFVGQLIDGKINSEVDNPFDEVEA